MAISPRPNMRHSAWLTLWMRPSSPMAMMPSTVWSTTERSCCSLSRALRLISCAICAASSCRLAALRTAHHRPSEASTPAISRASG